MNFYLNNQEITPVNALQFSLNSDFTGRPSELEISADKLVLQREAVDVIQNWVTTFSPLHGIPFDITTNGQTIEYYVDLTAGAIYRDFEIEVSIKRRKGKDAFFDQADGASFEYLANVKNAGYSFVDVPYIIVPEGVAMMALTLGVALYSMTKELIDQVVKLSETITQVIDAVTPQTGTGVTFSIGQIATLVIKALVQITVIGLLITAIIKMAQQFFELIFPKVRYFKACKVKELVQKSVQALGYTLSSTLLDEISGATILPVPLVKGKDSWWDFFQNDLNFAYTKGYPTGQDTVSTLGSLITTIENQYNARTRVINGVVSIERRDFWQYITPNQLTPALNLQEKGQSEYLLNTEEVWKRTYISYRTDVSDLNTLDYFDPTDAEYSTEPTNIPNADLVLIKGLNTVDIPFALGKRKGGLNWIEKIAKEFFDVVDEVSSALGSATNYSGQIEDRIGVMQLSSQFYSVTKYLWTVAGKQPASYESKISASAIYAKYHVINQINNNDYKIFTDAPVRMNGNDFVNLMNNNFAEIEGTMCEILKIQFFEESSHAIIDYKQPFDWANGHTNVLTINS